MKLLYYVYCHCPGELTILLVCVSEVCGGRCFRLVDRGAKSSWDGDGRVGGQAILCLLCNSKCRYHAHLRPSLVAFSMCGCSPSILVLSSRMSWVFLLVHIYRLEFSISRSWNGLCFVLHTHYMLVTDLSLGVTVQMVLFPSAKCETKSAQITQFRIRNGTAIRMVIREESGRKQSWFVSR